jgi:hypothetical protein
MEAVEPKCKRVILVFTSSSLPKEKKLVPLKHDLIEALSY